ncbi:polyadenylate-binding protein RBP47-like isoform X3 [Impatiens glandulifera]|nr:polyadenylate-binding protein RBP47-like isoform X2 [Impatiens glandulifera]XP_047338543.1 polyadenylate-binding protein RBP47-like isoform X3 [Impatiens glandulifera]
MMQSTNGAVDLKHQPPPPPQMYNHQPHQVHPQQHLWMQYYQQQWMAMQYPAAAMVMQQQQLLYPQQQLYVPYHHLQAYQQPQFMSQPQILSSSDDDNRTIWVGDLQQWMDETYLHSCFSTTGEVSSVKIIRNKHTGHSEKYGFVELTSHAAAEKVLQSFNGLPMPRCDQIFRLNWATFSTGDKRGDASSDFSIFVGDLAIDVNDALLLETFSSQYPSVKGAKVVVDTNTGRSKGYGFVRFDDENERSRAISEMNGTYCSSRQMRVGVATPKRHPGQQQYLSQSLVLNGGYAPNAASHQNVQSDNDLVNTTIFVGGLDSDVTDEDLRQSFSQYGEIVSIKIPSGIGCGFVQFSNRSNAEDAIQTLNGTVIGRQTVRLSWGRSR